MKKFLPLLGMIVLGLLLLGMVGGGLTLIGLGLHDLFQANSTDEDKAGPGPAHGEGPPGLLEARRHFQTNLRRGAFQPLPPPKQPGNGGFELVKYRSGKNELFAYASADPGDGKRHPAVVWAHAKFGGIREEMIALGTGPLALNFADVAVMVPSWRAENGNPGQFEMFYGEVDDLLAAVDYLASRPFVDPRRIYVIGVDEGGTLALLAATTGTTKFRAAFAVGGVPDLRRLALSRDNQRLFPFNAGSPEELRLRSAAPFVGAIRVPTFYFASVEENPVLWQEGRQMAQVAQATGTPFETLPLHARPGAIAVPLTKLIAAKIEKDAGPNCNITFNPQELLRLPPEGP